jgi:CRP-like cAMP-binding protein
MQVRQYWCLLLSENRTASVVAITVCELYLTRDYLMDLVDAWPEVREELKIQPCALLSVFDVSRLQSWG